MENDKQATFEPDAKWSDKMGKFTPDLEEDILVFDLFNVLREATF